jgi:hypothetical protein
VAVDTVYVNGYSGMKNSALSHVLRSHSDTQPGTGARVARRWRFIAGGS